MARQREGEMLATITLPFERCPVCGEEMPVQGGRIVEHGRGFEFCPGGQS